MLKKLTNLRKKYALSTTVTLSAEEGAKIKELPEPPDGITFSFDSTTKHMEYKKAVPAGSHEERMEYLQYEQLELLKERDDQIDECRRHLQAIRGCVVFFTILTVISLVVGLIVLVKACT